MGDEAESYEEDPRYVALRTEIESWWATSEENEGFDMQENDTDIFDDLPEIDSKIVPLTSPIFEKHLGVKLNLNLIRKGGYESIDHLITHLVPRMLAHIDKKGGDKGGDEEE